MAQSIGSVLTDEEKDVLYFLSRGIPLSPSDVSEILECDEGDVSARMDRIIALTGAVVFKNNEPPFGRA